jgi:hypothetical protein
LELFDMPHFTVTTNEDGSVSELLEDGVKCDRAIKLEPANAIVATYFKIAASNLNFMKCENSDVSRRFHGLQAFLMALTGVEAFTNVFFTLLGRERQDEALLNKVDEKFGPLVPRLKSCIELAFNEPIADQVRVLEQIRSFYAMRNQIVHPRWQPSSVNIGGEWLLSIEGLALNFQAAFEDERFCREAFFWCLLLVSSIGHATGNESTDGFCFHWTGQYDLSIPSIMAELGIS